MTRGEIPVKQPDVLGAKERFHQAIHDACQAGKDVPRSREHVLAMNNLRRAKQWSETNLEIEERQ